VLENEMIKVYDTSWKRIVVIKPPWTLSDILICMRKHWLAVFAFVMPTEAKPILESLNGFFGNITQSKGKQNIFIYFCIVKIPSANSEESTCHRTECQ
jgi:hypothetical protein